MIVDKNIAELICALEYQIGNQTYNPNSYNGWTGEEGCGYKYPVNYCKNKADLEEYRLTKTKSHIYGIDPECVETMKYAFGSNHLYIGKGIISALKYLEQTYGINFNELEKNRSEKRKKALTQIVEHLGKGKSVRISSGTNVVGKDLPVGRFVIKRIKEEYTGPLIIYIYNEVGQYVNCVIFSKDEQFVDFKENYIINSNHNYIVEDKNNLEKESI